MENIITSALRIARQQATAYAHVATSRRGVRNDIALMLITQMRASNYARRARRIRRWMKARQAH